MKLMLENRTQLVGISYLFIVAAAFASFEGVKPGTRVLIWGVSGILENQLLGSEGVYALHLIYCRYYLKRKYHP